MIRKRGKIVLWMIGILAAVSLAVATPGLVQLARQWKNVKQDFRNYGQALVDQRYAEAYQMGGTEFREATTWDAFLAQQRQLRDQYGPLNSVSEETMNLRTYRKPSGGVAVIIARLDFQSRTVRFLYEFHFQDGSWILYGYKQLST